MDEFRRVSSLAETVLMRDIRDECRTFMTGDQSRIGYMRQLWFWLKGILPGGVRAWLLYVDGHAVGYGYIIRRDRYDWLTGCVLKQYRGMGYGRQIFLFLRSESIYPAYLEVQKTNTIARRLYTSLGFRIVEEHEDAIVMRDG